MSDGAARTEIVEITSFEHLREQFFSAVDRVEAGEPVDIVLKDWQGFGGPIMWGKLTASGLGQPAAIAASDRALPYPIDAGV